MDDKKNQKLSQIARGFTIIETLLVIFVSILLLMAFFTLYDWHGSIYNFEQALIRASGSNLRTLQTINLDVRQAHRVLAGKEINAVVYNSSSTVLVLELPAVDSGGNILSGAWDYFAFYLAGGKLYLQSMPAAGSNRFSGAKLLSDSVDSLSFTYDNADFALVKEVMVDLRTRIRVRDQAASSRLQQNVYLKNY